MSIIKNSSLPKQKEIWTASVKVTYNYSLDETKPHYKYLIYNEKL